MSRLGATLEALDLGDRRFDAIFAVRVGLFHREPDRARRLVEPWLAPGGTVTVVFDEPAPRRAPTTATPPPGPSAG
jgi:hypothetical protein